MDTQTLSSLAFAIGAGTAVALLALLVQHVALRLALVNPLRLSRRTRLLSVFAGICFLVLASVDLMWPREQSVFGGYTWVIELVMAAGFLYTAFFQNEKTVAGLKKGLNWKARAFVALAVGTMFAMGYFFSQS